MVGGVWARFWTGGHPRVLRGFAGLALVLLIAGALSACGGSSGSDGASPESETDESEASAESAETEDEPGDVEPGDDAAGDDPAEDPDQDDEESDEAETDEVDPSDGNEDDSSADTEDPEAGNDQAENDDGGDDDANEDDTEDDDTEEASAPTSAWLRTSQRGDEGDHVEALQLRLNELGLAAGNPDGDYGRKTERAIKGFQRLIRVEPTGRADRVTLNNLKDFQYDGPVVTADSSSAEVETLQERLAEGPFDPGKPDGEYGTATTQAVWALEKLADIPQDGVWGPLDEWAWAELMAGRIGRPARDNDQRWVEVDLSEQLMKVYEPGEAVPVLISHISSGSGIPWENEEYSGSSITPKGDFTIQRRISGWRESSLNIGRLYNPLYFVGGIAFHGATSVPSYPASHGCVRVPMHIADYLPGELPNGTPVHVMA